MDGCQADSNCQAGDGFGPTTGRPRAMHGDCLRIRATWAAFRASVGASVMSSAAAKQVVLVGVALAPIEGRHVLGP